MSRCTISSKATSTIQRQTVLGSPPTVKGVLARSNIYALMRTRERPAWTVRAFAFRENVWSRTLLAQSSHSAGHARAIYHSLRTP